MSAWGTFIRHGHAQKCHRYNLATVKRQKRIQPSCFSLYSFLPAYSISSCSSLKYSLSQNLILKITSSIYNLAFMSHFHTISSRSICLSLNLIHYLTCLMTFQFELEVLQSIQLPSSDSWPQLLLKPQSHPLK